MLDKKNKQSLLQKILKSEAFSHSHIYQDLLSFLVTASIDGEIPKEYTIATEVFNKPQDFDPSQDTIVRVYMYNLRKKLELYYRSDGVADAYRIDIPKGHYEINFTSTSRQNHHKGNPGKFWILLVVLLSFSNIVFLFYSLRNQFLRPVEQGGISSPVWHHFLNENKPKQIVLGDHFFFIQDSNIREKRTIIRMDHINTEREFLTYIREDDSRRNLKRLTFPMFPRNSVWPAFDIVHLFSSCGTSFELNYASHVSADDLKKKDLIFVGSFHTLGNFSQTFTNSGLSYQVYPNVLSYRDEIKDTLYTYPEEGDPLLSHVDYGVVRKIPGPNNNTVFIFTSFHETGTTAMVKYMTDAESLKKLESFAQSRFGKFPEYFEILFKSSGFDRTAYDTELIHMREVDVNDRFW